MYSNKLAVAIKTAKSKVLREFDDTVYIPFGEEYSIFVKNLNSVRASVKVSVDGEDVGDGNAFIVDANGSIDIQRFIKNGNLAEGNRLKFIERSGSVEQHRGIGVEDGLVRVEFQFERILPLWNGGITRSTYRDTWFNGGGTNHYGTNINDFLSMDSATCSSIGSKGEAPRGIVNYSAEVKAASVELHNTPVNDAGITVPGSISDQEFNTIAAFPLEAESHVIVLKLLGQTESNKVIEPVTVKAKPKCSTCGRVNKATAKFCTNCGTSLTIV
jgi:hypothetical protein